MPEQSEMYNSASYYDRIYQADIVSLEDRQKIYRDWAGQIAQMLSPHTLLDVGCGPGLLMSGFRDVGVEAYGIDVSKYAISQVREQDKPFVHAQSALASLPESFPAHYDVVACIEVAEHIPEEQTEAFIARLCELGDCIVFSSSPYDQEDRTHFNVQQQEYWCKRFAANGYYRCFEVELRVPTEWTMCFRSMEMTSPQIVEAYERSIRIDELKRRHRQYQALVIPDYGQGFEVDKAKKFFYVSGEPFSQSLDLNGMRKFRILPVQSKDCLVYQVRLNGRNQMLDPSGTNGMEAGGVIAYPCVDPFIDFDLTEQPLDSATLQATFVVMESDRLAQYLMPLQRNLTNAHNKAEAEIEHRTCLEAENAVLAKQIEGLQEEKEHRICLETENAALSKQIERLQEEKASLDQQNHMLEDELTSCKEQIVLEREAHEFEQESFAHEREVFEYEREAHEFERESYEDDLKALRESCNQEKEEAIQSLNLQVAEEQARRLHFEQEYAVLSQHYKELRRPKRMVIELTKGVLRPPYRLLRLYKVRTFLHILHQEGWQGVKRVMYEKKHGIQVVEAIPAEATAAAVTAEVTAGAELPVSVLYRDTGNPVHAIPTVISNEHVKRLNLVTDTIESSSLLGSVATALIVATQFCVRYDYELRIITRNAQPMPMNYENLLKINHMKRPKKVSYYSDFSTTPEKKTDFCMDITEDDVFFATSWWSAEAIRRTTLRQRFFYIIQEVETFFYNFGGERMMCESLMHDENIDYIINSHFLNDYFRECEPHVYQHGVAFEPAFSKSLYHPAEQAVKKSKYRLAFYGWPHNPLNLFNFGIGLLNKAIEQHVIDTKEWEICVVGGDVDTVTFADGSQAVNMGQMSWPEYAEFLQSVDLALCLMYTPHPSYPPFDVACSGGVVVTNRYATKQEFPQCANVLMADLQEECLLDTLRDGLALALDQQKRQKQYEESTIPRAWAPVLEDVMAFMEERVE